jgi:hypothetical protein
LGLFHKKNPLQIGDKLPINLMGYWKQEEKYEGEREIQKEGRKEEKETKFVSLSDSLEYILNYLLSV